MFWRHAVLLVVTRGTGQNCIFPGVLSALGSWNDVIDGGFVHEQFEAAVGTMSLVPDVESPLVELELNFGDSPVAGRDDDERNVHPPFPIGFGVPGHANGWVRFVERLFHPFLNGEHVGSGSEVALFVEFDVDRLKGFFVGRIEEFDEGVFDGTVVHCLPEPVELED